jgi:hypothetical protein
MIGKSVREPGGGVVFTQTQTSAVEVPSPKVLPVVVGIIVVVALAGFIAGLKAADRSGGTVLEGVASGNAAALANAPNASPIILTPTELAPPPPPAPKDETPPEEETAVVAPEAPPPSPTAAPAPVAAPAAEAAQPPPAAANALY